MKNTAIGSAFFVLLYLASSFKTEQAIGDLLSQQLNNKIYINFDPIAFDTVLHETLLQLLPTLKHGEVIESFYSKNGAIPLLVGNGDQHLDTLISFLRASGRHGINPAVFSTETIATMLEDFKKQKFSEVRETYAPLAKLEIRFADAYLNYVSTIKYGLVNPKEVFPSYLIKVKQPDSIFFTQLLNASNRIDTLKQIQDKSAEYKVLQHVLLREKNDSIKKILAVNMERLRWVLPEKGEEFVQVNIPAFNLIYFKGKDTLCSMKVCVGASADKDYELKLKYFEKTGDYKDKPKDHETPMLFSAIDSFYTNPEWNIPASIASSELYEMARQNRNYLAKHKIKVYYKDKLVTSPSSIHWNKYDRDKLPFRFVQQSGPGNSLGKLKFAFANASSIFLHDTNNKQAFRLSNRAISHGCIRLENPLAIAKLLAADAEDFENVKNELGLATTQTKVSQKYGPNHKLSEPRMTLFSAKRPIPLLITYFTAWAKENGVAYVKDVYGLDEKLWLAMNRIK
ncbi:MAG: L,D-transpeptidase [Pedobacter sp.]|nr:MAG: L,D-transpeptidase [Pedobacter sp.]